MCRPQEFFTAAHKADMDVELVEIRDKHPDEPDSVNVWPAHVTRYPYATLVWPRPSGATNTIAWGDHFEFELPSDVPASMLVEQVRITVDLT